MPSAATTAPVTSQPTKSSSPKTPWKTLALLFVAVSCCKILLFPSYRSTDFDVHRNWLAITRHLPVKEWYYDDVNGTTVHTLDYPPSFAAFEYVLANNVITNYIVNFGWLDERCLALLPDVDNTPSPACVMFHRSTVVLSDIILWWGAWIASQAASFGADQTSIPINFLLIVLHPGLLWLDHIHFQYNGMLFGLLLASLGYLMHANNTVKATNDDKSKQKAQSFHTHHWKAAVIFAFLLTMKHLFLTLAPFYFVYLLRRYCLVPNDNNQLRVQPLHLITLGMYTTTTLFLPFLPFLKQLPQLAIRLFPFGRGLVHDYWAANVWALYSFADKLLGMLLAEASLPGVSAGMCALLTLIANVPGLYFTWKAAAEQDNRRLILSVVYAALSSFQLGFHVHEKAILNAIIPMTLLMTMPTISKRLNDSTMATALTTKILFLEMTACGLVGIFPLLFQVVELPVKLFSFTAYIAFCYHVVIEGRQAGNTIVQLDKHHKSELAFTTAMIFCIIVLFEFVPTKFFGRLEFLPLLATSVSCAAGLIICWVRLLLALGGQ